MKNLNENESVVTADLDEILIEAEADDIKEVEVTDIEDFNVHEKMKEVREIESDSDQKFKNKHSSLELFITKTKLKWYLAREEKHTKKFLKYKKLHASLSLAVASGFSNIKTHQEHLKSLSQRTEKNRKN